LFQQEYTHDFVNRWDELINWKGRWESEQGFFQQVLRRYDAARVLDIACGTGFHTVMLRRDGFDVTGADADGRPGKTTRDRLRAPASDPALTRGPFWSVDRGTGGSSLEARRCPFTGFRRWAASSRGPSPGGGSPTPSPSP
jgi:SAM-dependent methyltransferase